MNDAEFLDSFDVRKPRPNDANMVFYGLSAVESLPAVEIAQELGFKWFVQNFAHFHKQFPTKALIGDSNTLPCSQQLQALIGAEWGGRVDAEVKGGGDGVASEGTVEEWVWNKVEGLGMGDDTKQCYFTSEVHFQILIPIYSPYLGLSY